MHLQVAGRTNVGSSVSGRAVGFNGNERKSNAGLALRHCNVLGGISQKGGKTQSLGGAGPSQWWLSFGPEFLASDRSRSRIRDVIVVSRPSATFRTTSIDGVRRPRSSRPM